MRSGLILFFLFSMCAQLSAQFSDDFTDGNFKANPVWQGDTALFVINPNFELQSNGIVAGSAYLSTPSEAVWNASWQCWLSMDFNPSANNFGRFYLLSDTSDLKSPLNGYFIEFGGSSDELSLFRQDANQITKLIDGRDGILTKAGIDCRILVERDSVGNWALYSDTSLNGTMPFLEGTTRDTTYSSGSYSGIYTVYTSTRATKFSFDDFVVSGKKIVDTTSPLLLKSEFGNPGEIVLSYNEEIAQASAITSNFQLNLGLGQPVQVVINKSKVNLLWPAPFASGSALELVIKEMKDLNGNTSAPDTLQLDYFIPGKFDLIMTEVFADPDPMVGLPSFEYVELYNNTKFRVNLDGMQLSDGTGVATLSSYELDSGSYLILCKEEAVSDYQLFGDVLGVNGFPSLNNSGDELSVSDSTGNLMHFVNYESSWYDDALKDNGGWSLEMIDPSNPCAGLSNWGASVNSRGGTPGQPNSIYRTNPDTTAPALISTLLISDSEIDLVFNEALDLAEAMRISNYVLEPINPGNVQITSTSLIGKGLNRIKLNLSASLQKGIVYEFKVLTAVDCAGNVGSDSTILGISEEPEKGDVLINEILFEPRTGGADFLELYNNSSKILRLDQLRIATKDDLGQLKDVEDLSTEPILFFPETYLLLSADLNNIKLEYPLSRVDQFHEMNLPALPSGNGRVAIYSFRAEELDDLSYFDEWHYSILNETRGVSLERLSFSEQTQTETNWFSAASAVGYATPGYVNSQKPGSAFLRDLEISIPTKTISPNGDGIADFLQVNYRFEETGYAATGLIFDSSGRLVRTLFRNALMQVEGSFIWDGISENGKKVRTGPYILYLEAYSAGGAVIRVKEGLVINNY